jgi:hypothetical protein
MLLMPIQGPSVRHARRQSLSVRLALPVLLPAGCDRLGPKPKVPDGLQEKLIEGAFVQANKAKDPVEADRLFKEMDEFGRGMDSDIDRAARHRCNR